MEVKDLLLEAMTALEEVDLIEDKPLIDYAGACALVEIAYQLRRIANNQESTITQLTNGERAVNVFDESRPNRF